MFNSYSKESFIEAVASSVSIRQTLTKLNVASYGGNYRTAKKYIEKLNLDISHFKGQGWNKGNRPGPRRPIEDYLSNKISIQSYKLKERLIKEGIKTPQCEKCGRSTWNNKSIPIELHHINGNHKDNSLDNLQILCPNCHHQTENFRNNKIKQPNYNKAKKLNNYSRPKKVYPCIDCGKPRSRNASRCKPCSQIKLQNKIRKRPPKNQLIEDIKLFNNNKSAISRKYRVSQTAVRKWYKDYNIS